MKTNLKTQFLVCISLFFFFSLLTCDKEIVESDTQTNLKTVSLEETMAFFKQRNSKGTSKSANGSTITPDLNNITQDPIINSSELLTVIPSTIEGETTDAKILQLNINGELKSVVYAEVPDANSTPDMFTGRIYMLNLDGVITHAFSVVDNTLTNRLLPLLSEGEDASNSSDSAKSTTESCPECYNSDCAWCGDLDTVTVVANPQEYFYPQIIYLFDYNNNETDLTNLFWHGGGGGSAGAGSNSEEEEEECDDGLVLNEEGECVENWVEDDQNRNLLCGTYNFITVGNASVANITGLGMRLQNGYVSLEGEFTSGMCITIANTIPAHASVILNNAWNVAMSEVFTYVNATYIITAPTPEEIKTHILFFLNTNLTILEPGSVALGSPCSGLIPFTSASGSYCP